MTQTIGTLDERPHVVIIGAGFAGLWAAKELANKPVRVSLLDRNNYHTFLPLLYQVAAAEIEPEQIAYPVRGVLRRMSNVNFYLAEVTAVDWAAQLVQTNRGDFAYDYLLIATGSITQFFGTPGAEAHSFQLKTMEDGIALRNHILTCFEQAIYEDDAARRKALLTFVVVGAGPTGVEYAGALSELVYGPLRKDFPTLNVDEVSIYLVEATNQVLGAMPQSLGDYAKVRLKRMGVTLQLETRVTAVAEQSVSFHNGDILPTHTVVWVAGVGGHPLGAQSGLNVLRNGRIPTEPSLQLTDWPQVYIAGDLTAFEQDGVMLPMVAQVALQQGAHAAKNMLAQISGQSVRPFRYFDKGSMATIGRGKAVVDIRGRSITGFFAWAIWLVIHILYLIGFRNRIMVMINWAWRYLTYEQMVRLIFPTISIASKEESSST
jgi:NADH dehydrogenase